MGSGLGHWKIIFSKYMLTTTTLRWTHAHNEIIQGVFEMGIGFMILFVGYSVNIIRKFRKSAIIPYTALLIIFINSLVNFPFHIGTTAMVTITWMAVLEVTLRHENT